MFKNMEIIYGLILFLLLLVSHLISSDTYSEIRYWGPDGTDGAIVEYVPIDGYFAETMEVYDSVVICKSSSTDSPYKCNYILQKVIKNDTKEISNKLLENAIFKTLTIENLFLKKQQDIWAIYIFGLEIYGVKNNKIILPITEKIYKDIKVSGVGFPLRTSINLDNDKNVYIANMRMPKPYVGEFTVIKFNKFGKCVAIIPLKYGEKYYQSLSGGYYVESKGNIYQIYDYEIYSNNNKVIYGHELIKYFARKRKK